MPKKSPGPGGGRIWPPAYPSRGNGGQGRPPHKSVFIQFEVPLPNVVFGVVSDRFIGKDVESAYLLQHYRGQLGERKVENTLTVPACNDLKEWAWRLGSCVQNKSFEAIIDGRQKKTLRIIGSHSVGGVAENVIQPAGRH